MNRSHVLLSNLWLITNILLCLTALWVGIRAGLSWNPFAPSEVARVLGCSAGGLARLRAQDGLFTCLLPRHSCLEGQAQLTPSGVTPWPLPLSPVERVDFYHRNSACQQTRELPGFSRPSHRPPSTALPSPARIQGSSKSLKQRSPNWGRGQGLQLQWEKHQRIYGHQ